LAGRELSDKASRADFLRTATQPIASATTASTNQAMNCCCAAIRHASMPVASALMPIATPPQPGTAVNDAARSIVSRMNRKLSAARLSIGIGSAYLLALCAKAM
jgi:hypothetical protein